MTKGTIAIDSVPLPERTVRVSISPKIAFDIESFQKVQQRILGRFGCHACCSGIDIRFDIVRHLVVDDKLNIHDAFPGGVVFDG